MVNENQSAETPVGADEPVKPDEVAAAAPVSSDVESSAGDSGGAVDSGGDVEAVENDEAVEEAAGSEELDTEIRPEDIASDDDFLDDEDDDENVAPIEEMLEEGQEEEVRTKGDSSHAEMNWYILKVQVNREKSICDALLRRVKIEGKESFFEEILVPEEKVRQYSKTGKSSVRAVKMYPGYIVVRMIINDDTWFLVRDTPGIGDFAGAAGRPAPLPKEEIDRIIASTKPPEDQEESVEAVKTTIPFKVEQRVRVKEGHFENYEGEVSNVDERNGRVTVMISIFNRLNPVELHHWQIEEL